MDFLNHLSVFFKIQTGRLVRLKWHVVVMALCVLLTVACGGSGDSDSEGEQETIAEPTLDSAVEESLRDAPISVEVSQETDERQDLGQFDLTYPAAMQVETNATVAININLLELATEFQGVVNQERIKVDVDDPIQSVITEEIVSYEAKIFVSERMGARLTSLSFNIPDSNEIIYKEINYSNPNDTTFWTWDILAPENAGSQNFTVELFLEGDSENDPSWTRSVSVEVIPQITEPKPEPRGSSQLVPILLGVITLVALLGGGWYFMNNNGGANLGGPDLTVNRKNVKFGENADEIQDILLDTFNQDELRNLCDDFGLRFEDLGDTITVQTIKLVDFFARRNQLEELLEYIKDERPNVEIPFDDANGSKEA